MNSSAAARGTPRWAALEQLQQVLRGGSEGNTRCPLLGCHAAYPRWLKAFPSLLAGCFFRNCFRAWPGKRSGHFLKVIPVCVAGFKLVRGTFDPDFPARRFGLVGQQERQMAGGCGPLLGFICEVTTDGSVAAGASITNLEGTPLVILTMPTLYQFDGQVPPEIVATTSTSNQSRSSGYVCLAS